MRQTMTMSDGNIIVNCDEPINGYQQFVFSPGTIASWTHCSDLDPQPKQSPR